MVPKSPKALFRIVLWVVLLSLGGCSASQKQDAATAIDALCAAAKDSPVPDKRPERDVRDAVLLACLNRDAVKGMAPDAGIP